MRHQRGRWDLIDVTAAWMRERESYCSQGDKRLALLTFADETEWETG